MRSIALALCLALGLAAAAVTPDTSQLKQSCAQQLESAKGGEHEVVIAMQDSCLAPAKASAARPALYCFWAQLSTWVAAVATALTAMHSSRVSIACRI